MNASRLLRVATAHPPVAAEPREAAPRSPPKPYCMELYLLRHGLAYERDAKKYPDDRERPLTIEGLEKMREIVRGMLKLGVEFDAIFDSGYVRARQTAEAVTDAYRVDSRDIQAAAALEPESSPSEVLALLKTAKGAERVLLVGHEPHLSATVKHLTGAADGVSVDFKKGALCRIDLDLKKKSNGTLVWLLPPKALRKIR